ncbi:MAG: hypothetical protein JWN46_3215 [Acidimicrobiales bacterium]|nr:hypothetical protein [Acidimicrobiales bacterium]
MHHVGDSEAVIAALLDRIDALSERVDVLTTLVDQQAAPPRRHDGVPDPDESQTPGGERRGSIEVPSVVSLADRDRTLTRRGLLLGSATVAAAGAVGMVAAASPAAAADGDNLVLGLTTNAASHPTQLTYSNPKPSQGSFGFASVDQSAPAGLFTGTPAIGAYADRKNFFTAIQGVGTGSAVGVSGSSVTASGVQGTSVSGAGVIGTSSSGFGIVGDSASGSAVVAFSTSGTGVVALSGGTAVECASPRTQISLVPRDYIGAPAADGFDHVRGDLVEDSVGNLWLCTTGGKPGTWRKLAGPATAGALHVLAAPVRIYDSRPGTNPPNGPKTPLAPGVARTLDLKVNSSGVPAGATAAAVNLLVLNAAAGNAHLTVWAAGVGQPAGNSMVWGGSTGRCSSLAITALDAAAKCQVACSGTTDIAVDVVGYYL